jgi:oligoendopeptidase F
VDPVGTSIFYAFHFEGNYLDLMLLAHESGHAVQAMMMSRAGVPALNGRGAAWMTESFGRFNEFLVADFLYTAEQDPQRKALFRSELVKRAHVLYGAATEGAVELALHERIARGHASADALSDVTRKEGSRFSDRFAQPFDPLLWTRVETYYADPLHATSSMVSSILGLVLYHRFREAPDRFVEGYARLLSNGYDDTSQELLERFVGIDVNSETLVEEAIGVLRELSR